MKAKHIIIALIIVLLLGGLAFGSLIFVDKFTVGNFITESISMAPFSPIISSKKLHEDIEAASITKLEADSFSGVITIKEGDQGLELWSNKEIDYNDYIDYRLEGGTLIIEEKNKKLPGNTELYINLSVKSPEELDVEIKDLEGVVTIGSTLNSLKVQSLDGVFTSDTDESYDIYIGDASGVITFQFDQLNANLNLEDLTGIVTVLGESLDLFADQNSMKRNYGNGRDTIEIKSGDGIITIN